ncbi:carboxymuconolactone decarboxylase family protein [Saccharopolyspora sp. NPDC000359]|uniref:carboxymuconolactone decarboxylase family protein n=1 Tax=Saccharopolyspora sp. NPDC000359 TaxID=3154251 RepID=UPI00332741AA
MTTTSERVESRLPNPLQFFPELGEVAGAMIKAMRNGSIPQTTVSLVQLRAGQIVGSTYHTVRHVDALRESGEPEERITAVASWQDAGCFTAAERVALELTEAVFTSRHLAERVPDELFARVAGHYDEKALWTLILALGQIGFFIPVALVAKPIPGTPPGRNYSR